MDWIEYRINEALEKQLPELDLSISYLFVQDGPDSLDVLTELPEAVLNLKHLTSLDLRGHSIKALPGSISGLKNLRRLSLAGNRNMILPEELSLLSQLTHLDMAAVGRLGGVNFAKLQHLEVLDISHNLFTSLPDGVSDLRKLTELHLEGCDLPGFPKDLHRLRSLSHLAIGHRKGMRLSKGDLAGVANLTNLKHLHLTGIAFDSLLEEVSVFKGLEALTLTVSTLREIPLALLDLEHLESFGLYLVDRDLATWGGQSRQVVSNLRQLLKLKNLKGLALSGIPAATLTDSISEMNNLESLFLDDARLGEFPMEILALSRLKDLHLGNCGIGSVPRKLGELHNLEKLNLSQNPISSLPEEIGALERLKSLWLFGNELQGVPASLGKLSDLESLSLHSVPLGSWPDWILELSKLETLVLSSAGISEIPKSISRLKNLTTLRIANNQIKEIPPEIMSLSLLKHLDVSGNPIATPPPEIAARGTAAIQGYFSAFLGSRTSKLFEAKLIIVGEGEVGKTCLAHKLVNPSFNIVENRDEIATTRGIEIRDWRIETDLAKDFKINIWDFGGQEIYHATHQFFLTERSLYLFVWDARKEDRLGGFTFWLSVVSLLSDKSPILVVLNKSDTRIKEINQAELKSKYESVVGFHNVSALTGHGIPDLVSDIRKNIDTLPHVGNAWPVSWTKVRRTLEKDERDYISHEDYIDICESCKLERTESDLLITYLHDLGVILHYRDDLILQRTVILKPEWGTNAVYAVLDDKHVQKNNGKFSYKELARIWGKTEYPQSKHLDLLQLMIKFELCFRLGGSQDYIAPELLSATPPVFSAPGSDSLRFEYHYDFMPAGIITRFIARNHELIDRNLYWRNGTILSWESAKALITSEPLNRKIRVAVEGYDKKDLLTIIRREFAHIHGTLNNPDVKQMIPCICDRCRTGDPFLYEYQRMRDYLLGNEKEVICDKSIKRVSIEQLLTGVFTRGEIETAQREDRNVYVQGNYYESGGPRVDTKQPRDTYRSPWGSGSFYLLALVVVIASLAAVGKLLAVWILPIMIIGGLLLVTVIGALQMKQDERLSDKTFLSLMTLAFQQLPLLGRLAKDHSGKNKA